MNYIKHLRGFFDRLERDANMTALHISLYLALFQLWNMNRFRIPFEINRMDVMGMSRIGSRNTYSKCMKELNDWGYITYFPNSNRYQVSKVSCTRFDTTNGTTNDTANGTASDTASGSASGTTSGTLNINYSNYSKNKQDHLKNFNNGKEKKSTARFHVNNNKDYSEPL